MKSSLALAAVAFVAFASPALASSISVDFESATGYDLFNGATLSTAQSLSPTHSALLNDPVNSSLVRIRPVEDYGLNLLLGSTSASFSTFIPLGSDPNLVPYEIFGADTDGNGIWDGGVNDSLIIAFITGSSPYATNTWFQTGLSASTNVHVVGGRPGLTGGTFSSSGTQDTLAALSAMGTGVGTQTWGDLSLLRIYTEIGSWPGTTSYSAYVDDININAGQPVPEPTSMILLGSGLVGIAARYRRRKQVL